MFFYIALHTALVCVVRTYLCFNIYMNVFMHFERWPGKKTFHQQHYKNSTESIFILDLYVAATNFLVRCSCACTMIIVVDFFLFLLLQTDSAFFGVDFNASRYSAMAGCCVVVVILNFVSLCASSFMFLYWIFFFRFFFVLFRSDMCVTNRTVHHTYDKKKCQCWQSTLAFARYGDPDTPI